MKNVTVYDAIQQAFDEALKTAYPSLYACSAEIAQPKDPSFGDFQCNSAMKLAKQVGTSPREFAEKMGEELRDKKELFSSVSIAGPGFINVTLSNSFISSYIQDLCHEQNLVLPAHAHERIVVDFSSPNVAKEMHVGHLRSTIIGDVLARILEARGHEVLRQNHVGDWGTAFGMLIAHIQSMPNGLEKLPLASLADLMTWYRESKAKFDSDPVFKKQAQRAVVELQEGNSESYAIWKTICEVSRRAYQEIYDLLDIRILDRGESFYNPWLKSIVQTLEERGVVEVSDGAKCIFVEGVSDRDHSKLPLIVQKSDGGFNYDTTDMAALWHRISIEKVSRIIYVTGLEQKLHFQLVFGAAKKAHLIDPEKVRLDHVGFGLVLGPSGKKFKTRSGETERLRDLLDAACRKASEIIRERNKDWSEEEVEHLAHILGIGAVKYSDLSSNRESDYSFSYERMLKFEGNTAAFIMYSFVRALSILKKAKLLEESSVVPITLEHSSEVSLAKQLILFNDVLNGVEKDLMPHRLTDYLYALSEKFNQFFRDCRVEGDPREKERASLVRLTMRTIQTGLALLGIAVPEKM